MSGLPDFGHDAPSLSELGRRQAAAMARELRPRAPIAVYTSPLRPALETAAAIAAELGLKLPSVAPAFTTLTPEALPEGSVGEAALAALQAQAWSAVESLKEMHPPEADLVVVSHLLPVRAVVGRLLALPNVVDLWRFALDLASLTTIEFRGARTLLAGLNHTCHVEPAG